MNMNERLERGFGQLLAQVIMTQGKETDDGAYRNVSENGNVTCSRCGVVS